MTSMYVQRSRQPEVREKRYLKTQLIISRTQHQEMYQDLKISGEKGASIWLSVVPMKEMGNDAIKLRYDWPIDDSPRTWVCSEAFSVDHAMICTRGGFVIQRHNELRDIEAELLNMVCSDVQTEPVLQDITGEQLSRGTNKAPEARLVIHARGFWERQRTAFFDVRVCHPNADSLQDLEPHQIYEMHENEKKRLYGDSVIEVEHGTFIPLVFTTNGVCENNATGTIAD